MKPIAIIPARGGSQRIPRKNIKDFHGQPIIAYSIQAAKESGLFSEVVVSTDDAEIGAIALQYGASVHKRDTYYAQDEVGTQEVVRQYLEDIDQALPEYVCCIYATAPLMRIEDLYKGYQEVVLGYNFKYAMSVRADVLADAGQFYWGTVGAFWGDEPLIGPGTAMIPVPDSHVCDINTIVDWADAVRKYEIINRGGTDDNCMR